MNGPRFVVFKMDPRALVFDYKKELKLINRPRPTVDQQLPERQQMQKRQLLKIKLPFQRGHNIALSDFFSVHVIAKCNVYSNISPQHKDLNCGKWEELEILLPDLLIWNEVIKIVINHG